MRETHAAVLKARHDLERQSIEGSSTAQAVGFITFVQDLKRLVGRWAPAIDDFVTGQQTLERQRYQFPADWLDIDQVQGEWSAFNEILKRKNDSIQQQLDGLQMKIVAEDRLLDGRINEILADWDRDKPIQGSVKAEHAIATLNVYEGRLTKLQETFALVCRAKEVCARS
jgi:dynein heavy chain 1